MLQDTVYAGKMKVISCFIKPWELPRGELFLPIQGGKAIADIDLGMLGDDTGDQISAKNKTFGEFTAWYWAWKNIKKLYPDLEYIGLAHYRRYFAMDRNSKKTRISVDKVPKMDGFEDLCLKALEKKDIILINKLVWQPNLATQYSCGHNQLDYLCLKEIIHDLHPEYDQSFYTIMERNNTIAPYCLFIARYELFDAYMSWLFPLLFEAEKRINVLNYSPNQKRVFAYFAERLLSVYVYHNKLKAVYRPIYFIGDAEEKDSARILIKKIFLFCTPHGLVELHRRNKYKNLF